MLLVAAIGVAVSLGDRLLASLVCGRMNQT
jgi:hypothetical protein